MMEIGTARCGPVRRVVWGPVTNYHRLPDSAIVLCSVYQPEEGEKPYKAQRIDDRTSQVAFLLRNHYTDKADDGENQRTQDEPVVHPAERAVLAPGPMITVWVDWASGIKTEARSQEPASGNVRRDSRCQHRGDNSK